MNPWLLYIICAVGAYLIGNVQTAVIISKYKYKTDIRDHGSGNAGSTNMMRVFGVKTGVVTFVGDILKTVIVILLAWLIGGEHRQMCGYIAALFVVLGHNFPVFLQFRGGKGVACTLAALWMLTPWPEAVIATVLAVTLIATTRMISLAALCAMFGYVITVIIFNPTNLPLIALMTVLFLLIVVRHVENIKRILAGKESRIGNKKQ